MENEGDNLEGGQNGEEGTIPEYLVPVPGHQRIKQPVQPQRVKRQRLQPQRLQPQEVIEINDDDDAPFGSQHLGSPPGSPFGSLQLSGQHNDDEEELDFGQQALNKVFDDANLIFGSMEEINDWTIKTFGGFVTDKTQNIIWQVMQNVSICLNIT